jgi:hypothetical protein
MKKIFLLLIASAMIAEGCSKNDDNEPKQPKIRNGQPSSTPILTPTPLPKPEYQTPSVTLEVKFDESFENTIYPSFIYSMAQVEQNANKKLQYIVLNIDSDRGFQGRIKVTNDRFIQETIVDRFIPQGDIQIGIAPLWKYDDFINIDKPGFTHFKVELIDFKTDKVIITQSIQLSYRSINECVFGLRQDNGEILDWHSLFAAYVNEDSRTVENFLKEVADFWNFSPNFHGWVGYQLGEDYVTSQVVWICIYLERKGMKYSSITSTSNTATKILSQNVRLVENTITNTQANCVDGSVLLASIFKKIGLDCFLVTQPSHMFLAVARKRVPQYQEDYILIETTAIEPGRDYFKSWREMDANNANFIDINKARAKGIKPIQ